MTAFSCPPFFRVTVGEEEVVLNSFQVGAQDRYLYNSAYLPLFINSSFESQNDNPCSDHKDSQPFPDAWAHTKKDECEDCNKNKTEFANRSDLGCFTNFQRTKVADP